MKIIMLRHGQTEWNVMHKFQGQTDIALNDTGRAQANKIGDYIQKHENIEAIYCSNLSRSQETAEIIAHKLRLPVQVDKRLREIGFGSWEGMTYEEVSRIYPAEYELWFNNNLALKVPGGESIDELLLRVLPALEEIAAKHTGAVLLVSHGGLIKTVLNHLHGQEKWDIYLHPASLSHIEWDGKCFIPQIIGFTLPE